MAHQLYVLQVLTFNLLEEGMMTKMDPNDQVGSQQDRAFLARIVCAALYVLSTRCVPGTLRVVSALCLIVIPSCWETLWAKPISVQLR